MRKHRARKELEKRSFALIDEKESSREDYLRSEIYSTECGRWKAIWSTSPISDTYPNIFVFDSSIFDLDYDPTAPIQGDCVLQARIAPEKLGKALDILGIGYISKQRDK